MYVYALFHKWPCFSLLPKQKGWLGKPRYFWIILFSAPKTATLTNLPVNFSSPPRVFFTQAHLVTHSYQQKTKKRWNWFIKTKVKTNNVISSFLGGFNSRPYFFIMPSTALKASSGHTAWSLAWPQSRLQPAQPSESLRSSLAHLPLRALSRARQRGDVGVFILGSGWYKRTMFPSSSS